MVQFENPTAFSLLLLLIPITVLFLWFMLWRSKAIERLGEGSLISRMMPDKPRFKHQVRFALMSLSFLCFILAFANLQMGSKYEKVKRKGVDFMIALDVSRSMMAEDVKPSRLAQARQFISRMVDNLSNDRVGVILFAGQAFTQVPLTPDYNSVKLFLRNVSTDLIPTQGTAIGEAIRIANSSFEQGERKHKTLLVISDGENHEGDALEAAKQATKQGVVIHTMGVGSLQGGPIPIYRNGTQVDYKRDRGGAIVLSKINEAMLQDIAQKGEGQYFRMANVSQAVKIVQAELESMEKKEFDEQVITDYEDWFQPFLFLGLLFLFAEFFISDRKNEFFTDWKIFE